MIISVGRTHRHSPLFDFQYKGVLLVKKSQRELIAVQSNVFLLVHSFYISYQITQMERDKTRMDLFVL